MNTKRLPKVEKTDLELHILVLQPMLSPVLSAAAQDASLYGTGKPSRIKGLRLV